MVPAYVQAKLSSKDRRALHTKTSISGACQATVLAGPVRILCENGSEIRITPGETGLDIDVLIHIHPWLIGRKIGLNRQISIGLPSYESAETYISGSHIAWDQMQRPDMSGHEKLKLTKDRETMLQDGQTAVIDGTIGRDILVGDAGARLLIHRPERFGVVWYIESAPITQIPDTFTQLFRNPRRVSGCADRIGTDLRKHAQMIDATLDDLPAMKRFALNIAKDYGPLTFLVEALFNRLCANLKHTISRWTNRDTHTQDQKP
jgi:hypothetical protein